jgi:hypothetical protein
VNGDVAAALFNMDIGGYGSLRWQGRQVDGVSLIEKYAARRIAAA